MFVVLTAVIVVFWLWMILDFFQNFDGDFFSMVVFLSPVGALIYFFGYYLPRVRHESGGIQRKRRFRELLAIGVDHLPAGSLIELGNLYRERRQWANALACYEKALHTLPDQHGIVLDMVDCLLELKRPADAIPHLRRVIEKAPHYRGRAATILAQCLNSVATSAQALTELAPLAQMSMSPQFQYAYAELLVKHSKVDEAKTILQKLVRDAPLYSIQDRHVVAQAKKLLAKV